MCGVVFYTPVIGGATPVEAYTNWSYWVKKNHADVYDNRKLFP